jgi:hypothetical protein
LATANGFKSLSGPSGFPLPVYFGRLH